MNMAVPISEGTLLWEPSENMKQQANLTKYMQWLGREKGLYFEDLEKLWNWSVSSLEEFWASIWEYFHLQSSKPYEKILAERNMPGAKWFAGAELNYAEHVFRNAISSRPALVFQSEKLPLTEISWEALHQQVGAVAHALRAMGVQRGDRVVSYLPNVPEAAVAFLAAASLGAIWSSCSPDFGTRSVIDRFRQIEPRVLFAVDGYYYHGKAIDRRTTITELQQSLPTLQQTVLVPYLSPDLRVERFDNAILWQDMLPTNASLTFEQVPFEHPLWVLYSSGTTGLPKAIVQSQGGILLEHIKKLVSWS